MGRDFDVVLAPAGVASTTLSAGIGLGRARSEREHSASRMPLGDVCCDGKAFGMKGKKEDNALPTNIHENWGTLRNGANLAHRALKCSRQVGPAHRWPLAITARCLAPSYTIAQHQPGRRLLLDRIALARTGR
jgi:hypothetical protein